MNRVLSWFLTTATIVGVPVTLALVVIGCERATHTLTCEIARYGCERSFIHSLDYVIEQVEDGVDVTVTPRQRRK